MPSAARNFVLFKTQLFVFEQEEKDIDRWFVGGDCAGWFYARLLPVDGIRPDLQPVMEDWGWTFSLTVDDVSVNFNVWAYHPIEHCWLFGIEPRRRLFRRQSSEKIENAHGTICNAVDAILSRDERFLRYQWFSKSPFDLVVRDF